MDFVLLKGFKMDKVYTTSLPKKELGMVCLYTKYMFMVSFF
jgi:hypothetical protein